MHAAMLRAATTNALHIRSLTFIKGLHAVARNAAPRPHHAGSTKLFSTLAKPLTAAFCTHLLAFPVPPDVKIQLIGTQAFYRNSSCHDFRTRALVRGTWGFFAPNLCFLQDLGC